MNTIRIYIIQGERKAGCSGKELRARPRRRTLLFVGFRVVVALPVLLLGHVMNEVDVSHDPDNDLPRLHVLVGSVCNKIMS